MSQNPKPPIGERARTTTQSPLAECVETTLANYFAHLGDYHAHNLYHLVMEEVERPLFNAVLRHTRGNQTQAARLLGISRGTLRKKLALYDIK